MPFAQQKKSGVVALVVLNAGKKNFSAIFAGRLAPRDSRSIFQPAGRHVLHTASRIVERHRLDSGMAPEKITALIEGHGVGQHAAQGFKLYSRRCDDVVHDAKQKFALYKDLAYD